MGPRIGQQAVCLHDLSTLWASDHAHCLRPWSVSSCPSSPFSKKKNIKNNISKINSDKSWISPPYPFPNLTPPPPSPHPAPLSRTSTVLSSIPPGPLRTTPPPPRAPLEPAHSSARGQGRGRGVGRARGRRRFGGVSPSLPSLARGIVGQGGGIRQRKRAAWGHRAGGGEGERPGVERVRRWRAD